MKHSKTFRLIAKLIVFIAVHSSNLAIAQTQTVNQNDLVFKSMDGGANWQSLFDFDKNPIGRQVKKIVLDPTNSATIYLVTDKGVFKSTDGGGSWIDSNNGLASRFINDLIIDRGNPLNLYLTTPADITTHIGGLYKSSDAGRSWQSVPLLFEAPPAY